MGKSYNTWGGKDNSWGNRNRKGQSNGTRYEPNKLFNIIAGTVFAAMCVAFGWNILKSGIDSITQTKDTVEKIRDIVEYVTSDGKTLQCNVKSENSINVSEDTIEDILSYIYDSISENNENMIIIDSDDVSKESDFKNSILNRLDKTSNSTITFAIIYDERVTKEEAEFELERLRMIIENNEDIISDTQYTKIRSGAQIYNSPEYRFIATITFISE